MSCSMHVFSVGNVNLLPKFASQNCEVIASYKSSWQHAYTALHYGYTTKFNVVEKLCTLWMAMLYTAYTMVQRSQDRKTVGETN